MSEDVGFGAGNDISYANSDSDSPDVFGKQNFSSQLLTINVIRENPGVDGPRRYGDSVEQVRE